MKITKSRLKQIIKEELESVLREGSPAPAPVPGQQPAQKPAGPPVLPDPTQIASMLCPLAGGGEVLSKHVGEIIDNPAVLASKITEHAAVLAPILKQFNIPDVKTLSTLANNNLKKKMEGFRRMAKMGSSFFPMAPEQIEQMAKGAAKTAASLIINTACQSAGE